MPSQPIPCRKCGAPIRFEQRPAAGGQALTWWALDAASGAPHWPACTAAVKAKRAAPGAAWRAERGARTAAAAAPSHVWADPSRAPWDAALGAFRGFTADEIAAGVVCQPTAPAAA